MKQKNANRHATKDRHYAIIRNNRARKNDTYDTSFLKYTYATDSCVNVVDIDHFMSRQISIDMMLIQ